MAALGVDVFFRQLHGVAKGNTPTGRRDNITQLNLIVKVLKL